MARKFYITKSRSGHYSITAKELGYSATIGKLDSKQHADLARVDVGIKLDMIILRMSEMDQ